MSAERSAAEYGWHDKLSNLLQHFSQLLTEAARACPSLPDAADDFESGKAMAMYEVVSLYLETLRVFEVPATLVGAGDLDEDVMLRRRGPVDPRA